MEKIVNALKSIVDPGVYFHAFRILHYYGYSHVKEKRALKIGKESGMAPNASLRNASRIEIGHHCHIGDHCYLWAGNKIGKIIIGDYVSVAPGVFITASDYQFVDGRPFREQPKRERDVIIGNDVWLGAHVVVTAGVSIGDGCIIGAGAVVTKDIAANSIAVGIPAKIVSVRKSPNSEYDQ